jgi:two-component system, OmpR family, response regulator ChvI
MMVILTTIKHCLEETNDFIVDTFSNPLEVISAFQPELYDLILIDIKMPKMNGFELYQELRKKADNLEIRACFITAYETYYETLKSEFPELNVGCFISEPIESANLVKRIREELQIQV